MNKSTRRVLLLASYCGADNPNCSDDFPCDECLKMCNVCEVDGNVRPIGGFDYLKSLSDQPQEDACCEWAVIPDHPFWYSTDCEQDQVNKPYGSNKTHCPYCNRRIKLKS